MRDKLESIQIYMKPEDKELIKQACEISSLNMSSFLRFATIEKARVLLRREDGK